MRNAPAIQYPVQRSVFLMFASGLVWVAGAMLCAGWCAQDGYPAWRIPVTIVVLLATGGLALHALLHLKVGMLLWDGGSWQWSDTDNQGIENLLTEVIVEMDLQARMVLKITLADGNSSWIWVEAQSLPFSLPWLALRRAVFAPIKAVILVNQIPETAPLRAGAV